MVERARPFRTLSTAGPGRDVHHAIPAWLALSLQRLNVRGNVICRGTAQRHLRHLRVRFEQKISKPLRIEVQGLGNRCKRRHVRASALLVRRNNMARGAPSLGEITAMLHVGSVAVTVDRVNSAAAEQIDLIICMNDPCQMMDKS